MIPKIAQQLQLAINLLFSEGARYLPSEANQMLLEDLSAAAKQLNNVNVKKVEKLNLKKLAKVRDESIKSIVTVARAKFNEGKFEDSLALFSFLTTISPKSADYWFQLGVLAQKCNKLELASHAYAKTQELTPQNIGPKLLAADCFLSRNMLPEAKAEITQAKEIKATSNVDPIWIDLLGAVEIQLRVIEGFQKDQNLI